MIGRDGIDDEPIGDWTGCQKQTDNQSIHLKSIPIQSKLQTIPHKKTVSSNTVIDTQLPPCMPPPMWGSVAKAVSLIKHRI